MHPLLFFDSADSASFCKFSRFRLTLAKQFGMFLVRSNNKEISY